MYSFTLADQAFLANATSVASGPLLTDLVAYYGLDTLNDSHSNGYNLGVIGGGAVANYSAAKNGNGFNCATSSNYLQNTANNFNFNAKSYTYAFWFKSPNTSVAQTLFSWVGFGGTTVRMTTSKLDFYHYDGAWRGINQAYTISNNTLTHVVARFDNSLNQIKLFVNGSQAGATVSASNLNASSSPLLRIGHEGWGYQSNAVIDEGAIWYRALTDAEITQLYAAGNGLFYADF